MRNLIEGVKRYESTKRAGYRSRFAALAQGQEPQALFITCADSRVVPSLIALSDPGDIFVVRNIANLVPAADDPDASVAAAVYYALEVLQIRDVIVCGHSGCGGMKAALGGALHEPSLARWIAPVRRSVEALRAQGPLDATLPEHDQLSQLSALQQLDNLRSHAHVRARLETGDVRLHAWWFDISAGRLLAHSADAGRFVPAVDATELQYTASAAE